MTDDSPTPVSRAAARPSGAETANEHEAIASRLREAREYVGLLQEDVANALGIPRASVSALEAGKRRVSGVELRRLARLYRRSVGWLLGEDVVAGAPENALFRATESLSDRDKEQVLRFAEFLATAQRPARRGSPLPRGDVIDEAASPLDAHPPGS